MKILLMTLFLLFTSHTHAQAEIQDPFTVVEQAGLKLFERIAENKQALEDSPELMLNLIEQELMPIVDHKYAAYRILGKHLETSNKKQREEFVVVIRQYLVRTYASALIQYTGHQVTFNQSSKVDNQATYTSVNAKVAQKKESSDDLKFKMRKNNKTQQWKVYDLVVEGTSLMTSKQAEFNSRLNKLGIDQVTRKLIAANQSTFKQ